MKRKGFTLIELLAVIVILAVIALIATPLIMNVINDAKKNSFKDSAYGIAKAVQIRVAQEQIDHIDGENVTYKLNVGKTAPAISYSGELPEEGWAHVDENGKVELYIETGDYKAYYDEMTDNQVHLVDEDNESTYNTIKAKFNKDNGEYKNIKELKLEGSEGGSGGSGSGGSSGGATASKTFYMYHKSSGSKIYDAPEKVGKLAFIKYVLEDDTFTETSVVFEISEAVKTENNLPNSGFFSLKGYMEDEMYDIAGNCKEEFYDSTTQKCVSPYYEENIALMNEIFGTSKCGYSGYSSEIRNDYYKCSFKVNNINASVEVTRYGGVYFRGGTKKTSSYDNLNCSVGSDGSTGCYDEYESAFFEEDTTPVPTNDTPIFGTTTLYLYTDTPNSKIYSTPEAVGREVFLRYIIEDDTLKETAVGFTITPSMKQQNPKVTVGTYYLTGILEGDKFTSRSGVYSGTCKYGGSPSNTCLNPYHADNISVLKGAFGETSNSNGSCRFGGSDSSGTCHIENGNYYLLADAYDYGSIGAEYDTGDGYATAVGESECAVYSLSGAMCYQDYYGN